MVCPAGRTHLGVQGPLLYGPGLPTGFSSGSVFRAKSDRFDKPFRPPQHGRLPRSDLRDFGAGIAPNLVQRLAEGFRIPPLGLRLMR